MSSEVIIGILCVIILTLVIALVLTECERRHWCSQYETLRNTMKDADETHRRLQEIGKRYDEVASGVRAQYSNALSAMTLDEFVDSQG